jgi:hypothetical protein
MSLCGPSVAGTSSRVEGLNAAGPAETRGSPARAADQELTDGSAPYRQHTLISRQEHEAWDALHACQGQMRLAPSGHVIGIEMNTALRMGPARGRDLAVLSELLPASEAGLVEAPCSDRVRDDGP